MSKYIQFWVIWLGGITLVGFGLEFIQGSFSIPTGLSGAAIGSFVMILAVSRLRLIDPEVFSEPGYENGRSQDGGEDDLPPFVVTAEKDQEDRVRRHWNDSVESARRLQHGELLSAYRATVLRLYDELDLYLSEEIANYPTSKILWLMNKTKYSFWRFCRAAGK